MIKTNAFFDVTDFQGLLAMNAARRSNTSSAHKTNGTIGVAVGSKR
jgi:hypothetical protein